MRIQRGMPKIIKGTENKSCEERYNKSKRRVKDTHLITSFMYVHTFCEIFSLYPQKTKHEEISLNYNRQVLVGH